MDSEENAHQGPLAEFGALRQEIERRNIVQHALFVLQLTSAGAIFSFALSEKSRTVFLLIIPISTYMICARYIEQQFGIQRAATYIRTELSQNIPGGIGWEQWQIKTPEFVRGSTIRRINALFIMFPVVGIGALVWTAGSAFTLGRTRLNIAEWLGFGAIWVLGLLAVTMCVHMIWSVMRHPLGDASLPSLYRLPRQVGRAETSPQTTEGKSKA